MWFSTSLFIQNFYTEPQLSQAHVWNHVSTAAIQDPRRTDVIYNYLILHARSHTFRHIDLSSWIVNLFGFVLSGYPVFYPSENMLVMILTLIK